MLKTALVLLLLSLSTTLTAQEVYFSISGQNAKVESGEKKGVYDIWIKPKSGQSTQLPKIEVYDAGIGGFSDVLFKEANTLTSYSVYPFSALYESTGSSLIPLSTEAQASSKVEIKSEQKYKNRWVEIVQIAQAAPQGWIIRVETDGGDDVNNFKIRLTSAIELYDVVSLDLSIGLYKLSPTTTIQLQPLFSTEPPPALSVTGEEDVKISKMDAFGAELVLKDSTWIEERFGLSNKWALVFSGSQQRLNNLVISGGNKVIPWIIQPLIKEKESLEKATINTTALKDCNQLKLEVNLVGYEYNTANTIWLLESQRYVGKEIQHEFQGKGTIPVTLITPTQGRYAPLYIISERTVFVNQAPVLQIEPVKTIISPSEPITINASKSYDPEGKPVEFAWFVDGVFRGTDSKITFTSSTAGNYSIRLLLDDKAKNSACTTKDTTIIVRVNTQPYAEIELNEVVAQGSTTNMVVSSVLDSDNDELSYSWDVVGLKGNNTTETIDVEHKERGLFTAKLSVKDKSGTTNSEYITERSYKVNGAPKPQFSIPNLVAPGQTIRLSASSSSDPDLDKLTYAWLLSDSRESKDMNWPITFESPGEYQITLRVNDGMEVSNSEQKLSKPIRVNEAPIAIISSVDKSNDAEVVFSADKSSDEDQSIETYLWDFGDGRKGEGKNLKHQFAKAGLYTIKLTVDDGQGLSNSIKSTEKTVRINKNPIASFAMKAEAAPGEQIVLNASSSKDEDGKITVYEWFKNGVLIGTGETFNYSIAEPGDQLITLKVKDDSGFESATHSFTKLIHINHSSKPRWTANPKVTAPGKATQFSANLSQDEDDSKLNYSWKFGKDIEKKGASVTQVFEKPGIVEVSLKTDDGRGLSNSIQNITETIRINASPIIVTEERIVSNVQTIHLSAAKSYDADGSSLLFQWIMPDGSKRNEPSFTWQAPNAGYFKIGLQIDDQEGLENSKVSTGVDVIINRPVVAVVDSLIEACTGQIIIFSSARSFDPDGDQFSTDWDFGDGSSSRENNPYHTYEKPGVYIVTLKLTDGISEQATIAQIPVKIAGSPTAKMSFLDSTICVNTPIVFDASPSTDPNGPIGAYSWDFGDGSTGFGKNVTHLYSTPGVYKVVLTVIGSDAGTCSNVSQTSSTITIVEGPEATFEIPEWASKGDVITLNGSKSRLTGELKRAEWLIIQASGKETRLEGINQKITATESGNLIVRLIVEVESGSTCNTSVAEKTIKVNQEPLIVWNVLDSYPAQTAFAIQALGTKDEDGLITSYQWFIDGKAFASGVNIFISSLNAGSHTIELEVKDNSKVKSGTVRKKKVIQVNAPPKVEFAFNLPIYTGETLLLSPKTKVDSDGDSLTASWIVNDEKRTNLSFKANESAYTIKLIQNDGKGLSNSKDSLTQTIRITEPPELDIQLPERVIIGTEFSAKEIGLPSTYYFYEQTKKLTKWVATTTGFISIPLVWAPRDSVLKQDIQSIEVLPKLKADSSTISLTIKWNPANPFVEVNAPSMNRSAETTLTYQWKQNGLNVALGKMANLKIEKGLQKFELIISEQGVLGSKPTVVPVSIEAK